LTDDVGSGSTVLTKLEIGSSSAMLGASPEAKLAALLEINRALAHALALDAVLPKVLESLFRIFVQADRGFIVLKDPNGELVPRWMHTRRAKAGESARISRTIVRQVLQTKEAILSADAASDDRFDMSQSLADFRIRSLMCAPLLSSEGEALGVLQLDTLDQRKRFDQQDLEILAAVAAQAGIAIANAQLHEQILRQRTLERDLQLANQVQRSFLPAKLPDIPGYEFFHYYQAANQVGGDYFDYVPLPEDRLAIVLADVVGHGVAAALLMARLSAETRYCLATEPDVGAALAKLNNRFLGPTPDRFITMAAAVLDPHKNLLQIAIAGHMPPLWKRQDGTILDAGEEVADVPIGVAPDIRYATAEIQLAPSDLLLFYTDGISEAMDANDQCFGVSRIRDFLQQTSGTAANLGEGLIRRVRQFAGANAQSDDICIVCLRRK
jgi:serine phosphatase RsbU (regulator of sigma subunit)